LTLVGLTPLTANGVREESAASIPRHFSALVDHPGARSEERSARATGATIGHQPTHGFGDEGHELDASGALRDWWMEADAREFKARAAVLGAQYAAYEPVPACTSTRT
jgi:hypothetical protein